ncbi:hypothetical protein HQ520_10555, partial [bacterium]|nr:hypothetical protein [bacterium]
LFRLPGAEAPQRRDAPEEIANAAHHVLTQHISMPQEDLIRETARLFGYQRTGQRVEECLCQGIWILTKGGTAREEDGRITQMG